VRKGGSVTEKSIPKAGNVADSRPKREGATPYSSESWVKRRERRKARRDGSVVFQGHPKSTRT